MLLITQVYLELPCAEYWDRKLFLGLALGFALGRTGLEQINCQDMSALLTRHAK